MKTQIGGFSRKGKGVLWRFNYYVYYYNMTQYHAYINPLLVYTLAFIGILNHTLTKLRLNYPMLTKKNIVPGMQFRMNDLSLTIPPNPSLSDSSTPSVTLELDDTASHQVALIAWPEMEEEGPFTVEYKEVNTSNPTQWTPISKNPLKGKSVRKNNLPVGDLSFRVKGTSGRYCSPSRVSGTSAVSPYFPSLLGTQLVRGPDMTSVDIKSLANKVCCVVC